ncbi:ATP-dependent Clp protease adapter ClpS [Leucobacter rhizosphaerae]|uniref:ATP-dependent Clp protease adapter protein ClpS n=1 Tax=Leucobacter rhizosphaerae TaxID=2932245 RepID=A0ABY4FWL8_9MICO|nr:ATP-dependent Clp protease adapter ClpS [Leucobacter rhizosphaerae]UOQ60690.1 ATP-dependent Clp protease adapter ClpS [Leucobacter rhizosphaerae]
MVATQAQPGAGVSARTDATPDPTWQTVVWDDPVNLMSYVAYVFQTHFGFERARAEELMLQVHHQGKAVVAEGSRETMEMHVEALHGYGLWATVLQGGAE